MNQSEIEFTWTLPKAKNAENETDENLAENEKQELERQIQRQNRKRRRVSKVINPKENLVEQDYQDFSELTFTVNSSRDKNKYHVVKIQSTSSGIDMTCTCGDEWNLPPRNHCKHIGNVIGNIMKQFVKNNFEQIDNRKRRKYNDSVYDENNMDQMVNLFKNIMNI